MTTLIEITNTDIRHKIRGADISGEIFGRWTAISKVKSRAGSSYWLCQCICGVRKEVALGSLRKGISQSCGCLADELSSKRLQSEKMRKIRTKHGLRNTKEYDIWFTMKARCYDKNSKSYPRYGGRGITVCDRWLASVENFVEDMGLKPENMSLDRIDNNGGYCKENCRWATDSEQRYNSSTSVRYDYNGKMYTTRELAEKAGVSEKVMGDRLVKLRWPVSQAVELPLGQKGNRGLKKLSKSAAVKFYQDSV